MAGKIEQAELALTESVAQTDQALSALDRVVDGKENAGGLPREWSDINLESLAKFIDYRGRTPTKTADGIPLITAKNIRDGFINREPREFIAEEDYDDWMTRGIPRLGDVVITTEAPMGNVARIDISEKFALAQRSICLYLYNQEMSGYLFYALRSPEFIEKLGMNSTGTTVKGIKSGTLKKLEIPLPPLAEQTVIAQTLDILLAQVDNIKTRLDAIPNILKTFRQSVLAAAVSGKLTEEWRGDNECEAVFPDMEGLTEFKQKTLGVLPLTWKWERFDTVAEIASNLEDPMLDPQAFHIAPNHIESKTGRLLEYTTIENDNVKSNKHRFFAGQILYSKIRPYLAKVALADFTGMCSADMYPVNSKIDRDYLFRWMLTGAFTDWASNAESRSVLPKINQKDLSRIPVPTPPIEEQTEIVRRVEELFAFADQIEQQVKNAQGRVNNLTQSILAKAFRGELTTQWRAENPALISGENSAEALLAKIQKERAAVKQKAKPKKKSTRKKSVNK